MRGYAIPAVREHIAVLLEKGLRAIDVEDLADIGQTPEQALELCFTGSFPLCLTIMAPTDRSPGEPVGMFGACPSFLPDDKVFGCIWLLCTEEVRIVRQELVEQFPSWIRWLCEPFDVAGNDVYEKNTAMIRLLGACGFETIAYSPPRVSLLWTRRDK